MCMYVCMYVCVGVVSKVPANETPNPSPPDHLSGHLLTLLHHTPTPITIQLAIISSLNSTQNTTSTHHYPHVTDLFISLNNGHIITQPVYDLNTRGPELGRRSARSLFSGDSKLLGIYDEKRGEVCIEPFELIHKPPVRGLQFLLVKPGTYALIYPLLTLLRERERERERDTLLSHILRLGLILT